jgi:hypothetical protein
MSAKWICVLVMFVLGLSCMASFRPSRHAFEFCAAHGGFFDKDSLVVDVQRRRVGGTDTSYDIAVIDAPMAKGFIAPLPLMLPKLPLDQMPNHWEVEGYRFAMSSMDAQKGIVSITAQAIHPTGSARKIEGASYVYSAAKGLLSLRLDIKEGPTDTLVSCGTRRLLSSSF